MLEKDLFICENAKPVVTPGATWTFATLPTLVAPNYWDLKALYDLGKGAEGTLWGNLRVSTAFTNTANNFLRLCAIVDVNGLFSNVPANPHLVVARGPDIPSAKLGTVGQVVPLAIPPYGDILRAASLVSGGEGYQFFTLAVEYLVPTTDWVAAGIDVFLSPKPLPLAPAYFAAGY